MKKLLIAVLLLAAFGSIGCAGRAVKYQPLVSHRVWEQETTHDLFDAAVRVLHTEDFLIAASDKDSGLISTDWKTIRSSTGWKYKIRINLLILEEAEGYVAISFKSKVEAQHPSKTNGQWVTIDANDPIDKRGYEELTRTLDDFFLEIQRYAGPSVQQR